MITTQFIILFFLDKTITLLKAEWLLDWQEFPQVNNTRGESVTVTHEAHQFCFMHFRQNEICRQQNVSCRAPMFPCEFFCVKAFIHIIWRSGERQPLPQSRGSSWRPISVTTVYWALLVNNKLPLTVHSLNKLPIKQIRHLVGDRLEANVKKN